jgi:molybdopterin-guanine dinucleotide biosynthesis protein A
MGQAKAHLPWGDGTLLEHVIDTLRPIADEVIVAVKDARAFRDLPVNVVEDLVPGAHAIGGLYTGLRTAAHDRCFVCACDMPFLNRALIQFLAGQADGYDLVIPHTTQGLQPLHAVYAKTALGVIAEHLYTRQWDLRALVPKVRARVVEAEQLQAFDPEALSLFNVNTREDFAKALSIKQDEQRR